MLLKIVLTILSSFSVIIAISMCKMSSKISREEEKRWALNNIGNDFSSSIISRKD